MQIIRRPVRAFRPSHHRSGLTTPAICVALLVIMMGIALIIDRIWLETAKLELKTAAESAALAAAGELAGDGLLLPNTAAELRINNARQTGGWIASQNYVCGTSVTLNDEPDGDFLFGHLVEEHQGVKFAESADNPTTVVVTASRTRANNNPIALVITGAGGISHADVVARAEATISNDVVGLRPIEGSSIPAVPIAIWQKDPEQKRKDTWNAAIEERQGADEYTFDKETHSVVKGADGIPELVLKSYRTGGEKSDPNVLLLDLGTGLADVEVDRQFQTGISVDDLQTFDGEIECGQGRTLESTASNDLSSAQSTAFEKMIGECRICFLYSETKTQGQSLLVTAVCTEIVAVRVMAVNVRSDGSSDVTIQPTVILSRNIVRAVESLTGDSRQTATVPAINLYPNTLPTTVPNRYLYKLQLTH